jgi:hypothetical protein
MLVRAGIHPRLKRPVGERLAKAAYNQVYGGAAASTGPTISGCKLSSSKLTLIFDPELLKSSKVVVQPNTNATAVPTTLQVSAYREWQRDYPAHRSLLRRHR